jgi:tetraacyldisaccharide 4'-kinase
LNLGAAIIHPESFHALVSDRARGVWPGAKRLGLWAASVPYGWGVTLRNRLYDRGWKRSVRAPLPVVSIGNLTLGGTGKTPCVEYVARFFRQRDLRVAILSRGYGSTGGRNDEALVLEQNLPDVPHLQGADRLSLAAIATEELESEVLVLDDGFQHRRLARDLDLVLLDATEPWGHGYLFPRGLLREPPSSLRRAGAIVLTRCEQASVSQLERLRRVVQNRTSGVPIAEAVHRPVEWVNSEGQTAPLDLVLQHPLAAFCGIGNPAAFQQTLHSLGATSLDFRTFVDHHRYTREDVSQLHAWARQQPAAAMIVTTQKDLVKLRVLQLGGRPLWALRIALEVRAGKDALEARLEQIAGRVRRPDSDAANG